MITPLSGLFPIGGKDWVACLLLTGPGELVLITPIGLGKLSFLMVTPHWARECMLTS